MGSEAESRGHKKLKNEVYGFLKNLGFIVDKEVHLNISGSKENKKYVDEFSCDVVAKFQDGRSCIFFFECKDKKNLKGINAEFRNILSVLQKIKKSGVKKVTFSEDKKIKTRDFKNVDDFRYCIVFSEKIGEKTLKKYRKVGERHNIFVWCEKDIKYFAKMSNVLGKWEKYELFRELRLSMETHHTYGPKAIKIRQNNYHEIYLTALPPSILLKIGYVYRRASGKHSAYQRILSKDRILKIQEFVKKENPLFPNAIIIAFDGAPDIQENIEYDDKHGTLKIPIKYCSAWIIDGQHRLYGFTGTKYEKLEGEEAEKFKLPTVIFKKLDETLQCRTFININYYQKKIDPTLLCDLATITKDLKFELTWASLLGQALNKEGPLKNTIKVSEFDKGKPITLSGFVRYGLLETLLGYNKRNKRYSGPLFSYAPFNVNKKFESNENKIAFEKQKKLLIRFFSAVKANTKKRGEEEDPWRNFKRFALLRVSGINALFLVLNKIMNRYPRMEINLEKFLQPLSKINFERDVVASYGGGWKGFRKFANKMIRTLNKGNNDKLKLYRKKSKR